MSDIRWERVKGLLTDNPHAIIHHMEELEHTEGWKHVMKIIDRQVQSMRNKVATTGIDQTAPGQVINHNRNVYTSAGLLLVKELVREIKTQAAAVLKERPDVGR